MWLRVMVAASAGLTMLSGQPADQESPAPSAITDPEAYAVYASLLPENWLIAHAGAKLLVFQEETATYPRCGPSGGPLETVWRPVVEAYRVANTHTHTIRGSERLGYPYIVVPEREIKAIFAYSDTAWGWTDFLVRFRPSRGFIRVSAVGFDASKTRAMVYLGHHCGLLCGGGEHHLLEKVDGRWTEAQLEGVTQCSWIS